MRPLTRAQFQAQRICPACLQRNEEVGQRGPRLMHQVCRKWMDHGMTYQQIETLARQEAA